MRLIDADKLTVRHGVNIGANYGGLRAIVLESDVKSAPTIEAIPIEWIKKWSGNEPYWVNLAEHMLDDWEKENEKEAEELYQ